MSSFALVPFAVYILCLIWAVFSDLYNRIIPNVLSVMIAVNFLLFVLLSGMAFNDVMWRIGIAAIAFACGAILFFLRFWGGGDAKFLSVILLWIPSEKVGLFLLAVALIGGLQAFYVLIRRKLRQEEGSNSLPYGVALAGGAFLSVFF